jgi:hypothetical protein
MYKMSKIELEHEFEKCAFLCIMLHNYITTHDTKELIKIFLKIFGPHSNDHFRAG